LAQERVRSEEIEAERMATSRQPLGAVQGNFERVEGDARAAARQDRDSFRAALEDARARAGPDGNSQISYDNRDPIQSARADLMIQYLVRPDFAELRTEERGPDVYVYHVRVEWDRLRALAISLGHEINFQSGKQEIV
jgi:hypothetical protein